MTTAHDEDDGELALVCPYCGSVDVWEVLTVDEATERGDSHVCRSCRRSWHELE